MPSKKWTEEEEEFLKENFMTMSNAELAEHFDITKNAVQKKLARMGLKRSKLVKTTAPDKASEVKTPEEKKTEEVSGESHFFLGSKLFYEDRDYEGAIQEYQKAAAEESDKSIRLKAQYWMAESYVKIGKTEDAINIFEKLAKKHEGHYLGDSARRRIKALAEYVVPVT